MRGSGQAASSAVVHKIKLRCAPVTGCAAHCCVARLNTACSSRQLIAENAITLQDTIPEKEVTTTLAPPIVNTAQLGLLGEDLELKGERVGSNLAALFTQSLYQDHDLRAPAKSNSALQLSLSFLPFVCASLMVCGRSTHVTYGAPACFPCVHCVRSSVTRVSKVQLMCTEEF